MAHATLPVRLEHVQEAAALIRGIADNTPLYGAPGLSSSLGVSVYLKGEHRQPVGAFKARGAYNAIARLDDGERARGVITYSSGNHGQAVAWAAKQMHTRAVIVMPETVPSIKSEGVRRHGGEVVLAGRTSADRYTRAMELVDEHGYVVIPPFDHPDVMAGQGTCGLEILEQRPDVSTILVPVGGGGLIAGIATVVAALRPEVEVIGVEPAGAAKLTAALDAGEPVTLDHTESLADGLLPLSIGKLTFPQMRSSVHRTALVSDDDLLKAMRYLRDDVGERVEPSGAATTAALLGGHVQVRGTVVAVISGGNIEPERFDRLVAA